MTRRVLVVDDHERWRRGIGAMLATDAGWLVVGEARDGWEALKLSGALVPDLILLDVELPAMSGIEVARRILADAPDSKILFVSAHRSWDIVDAAFAAGARGYLLKSDAGYELLPAMHAVAGNRCFLSGAFVGRRVQTAVTGGAYSSHRVGFYANDALLLESLVRFSETALSAGQALIVAGRGSLLADIRQRLAPRLDIDAATQQGRYLALDAADVLGQILVNGHPDDARFWKSATPLVLRAARAAVTDHVPVAGCGECCGLLARSGQLDAAIRLEQLWDECVSSFNIDMFCAYHMDVPGPGANRDAFDRICIGHGAAYSQ